MKTIYDIARNELRKLFYSPIAWIILVVFSVQAGLVFSTDVLGNYLRYKASGWPLGNITTLMFAVREGVFPMILGYLYLYVPLLTMGIISREKNSGSFMLLKSSSVRDCQIVAGKFLSMMAYGLILMSMLFVITIFCWVTVKDFDIRMVLAGLLGIYLLILTYAAIGIFMSGLTRYQIVAAIATIAMLFVMNYAPSVWQDVPFVREVAYWIGLSGRADEFISGLIASENVIYFIVMISLFLTLTTVTLRMQSRRTPFTGRFLRYTGVVLLACLAGYVSSRPKSMFFYDATRTKSLTLTAESQRVMEKLDGPLTITTYVNLLGNDFSVALPKSYNQDVERFSQYTRFKPEIRMKYVYYYHNSVSNPAPARDSALTEEERARKLADAYRLKFNMFLPPSEIDKIIDLSSEEHRFVRHVVRGDGRSTFLRIYDDMFRHPAEAEITAALKRLVTTPPKVGFLEGHGERDMTGKGDNGYFMFAGSLTFRQSLLNQGFDTGEVRLDAEIPDDIEILVIADPREMFSPDESQRIEAYVESGRNLLIAVKPDNRNHVEPVTDQFGIAFSDEAITQENELYSPDLTLGNIGEDGVNLMPGLQWYADKGYKIAAPGTLALSYTPVSGFRAHPIIVTDDAVPIVMALQRETQGRTQKVVVMGNADIIANGELMMSRSGLRTANYALITESFRWLMDGEFPIDTSRPKNTDDDIYYITNDDRGWLEVVFTGILPGIAALFAVILLVRRQGR